VILPVLKEKEQTWEEKMLILPELFEKVLVWEEKGVIHPVV
jgi:hypothetical protein